MNKNTEENIAWFKCIVSAEWLYLISFDYTLCQRNCYDQDHQCVYHNDTMSHGELSHIEQIYQKHDSWIQITPTEAFLELL